MSWDLVQSQTQYGSSVFRSQTQYGFQGRPNRGNEGEYNGSKLSNNQLDLKARWMKQRLHGELNDLDVWRRRRRGRTGAVVVAPWSIQTSKADPKDAMVTSLP